MITTFTGLILRVFRFINKLLGIIVGFSGLWASLLLCGIYSAWRHSNGYYFSEVDELTVVLAVLPIFIILPFNGAKIADNDNFIPVFVI